MATNPHENLAKQIIERTKGLPRKDQATYDFFKQLMARHPLPNIYYPGNGFDFILNSFFNPSQILYLDSDPRGDNVIKGDFRHTFELPNGIFASIFLQDTHATRQGVSEMLRTVAGDGLVILSEWRCGIEPKDAMPNSDIIKLPYLKVEEIIPNSNFITLRKHAK